MKMNICFLFLFGAFSNAISQESISTKLPTIPGRALQIEIDGITAFLFDSILSEKYIRPLKYSKYRRYWEIDTCEILNIEKEIKSYIKNNYPQVVADKYFHYIRQYFPFFNNKGDQIVIITLSFLNEYEKEEVMRRLPLFPRYVFDDVVNFNYLSLVFNYTNRSWGSSAKKKPTRSP